MATDHPFEAEAAFKQIAVKLVGLRFWIPAKAFSYKEDSREIFQNLQW